MPGPRSRPRSARSPSTPDAGAPDPSSSCAAPATTAATASWPPGGSRSPAAQVVVAVVATEARPRGAAASRNWDRIARDTGIAKVHAPVARDVAVFGQGIERAAVIVDALLGTGVRRPAPRPDPNGGRTHRSRARERHPGRGRRHADRDRPLERRAVRAGGPGRPDRHVPPAQDRLSRHDGERHTPARSSWRRSASRPRPTVVDARPTRPQPGWREVLLVAVAVVAVVLGRCGVDGLPPDAGPAGDLPRPVLIVVLIVGTGWLLWRIARGRPADDER